MGHETFTRTLLVKPNRLTYSRLVMNGPPRVDRRVFLAGAASSLLAGPALGARDAARPPVLVELFTSQGCNYCPPADAFVGELIKRRDVIAVSLNVDYWDYDGWRDTLASPAFSQRQREYARYRGDTAIYTPQIIVNGVGHLSGGDREKILAIIDERASGADDMVAVSLSDNPQEVVIEVAEATPRAPARDATVWLVMVQPSATVKILRGENQGRTITYHNVVRRLIPAGMWHGPRLRLALPKSQVFTDGASVCAAVVQVGGFGPVIGIAGLGPISGRTG